MTHLSACEETVELDVPQCPACGASLSLFRGTDNSEVLEIEVRAYRRVIRRQRYRCGCDCGVLPRIVAAPAPARLIERGKFGISVWVNVLLDKFLYGCPSQRLLHELADHGLPMAAGTLAGGLRTLSPLFAPLHEALRDKLRSEPHWHADETRWEVFVELQGKVGHRWYLWVFQSRSVVHYVLDESRSSSVVEAELAGVERGYLSCDRHGAYKKHARQHPGIVLAFCWAHQRRDWLMLGNDHPELQALAMQWVEQIGQLYRLHGLRAQADVRGGQVAALDAELRGAVQRMAQQRDAALADATTHSAARKVLLSMHKHWAGLTVFVEQPWLAMDNNAAERAIRPAVVGRKNFYGSGSQWSGQLAATMYSVLMTARLWGLNARTWLSQYLHACADNGNRAPADIGDFLPWAMDAARLAAMRAVHTGCGEPPRHRQLMSIYCGREFGAEDIQAIRQLIEHHPGMRRAALSRKLCELFDWVQPNGELKDMTCRVALLRMQADGLITLPASRMSRPRSRAHFPPTPATDAHTALLQPVHESPS